MSREDISLDADEIDAPESLDREKALALTAVAAISWHTRDGDRASGGRALVERLMLAASWVSRARRNTGLPPLNLSELVAAFDLPVMQWLPGSGGFALYEDGEPTPLCRDLADDAGPSPLAEVEQDVIKVAMDRLVGREDEAPAYTEFRRFLVEHAHTERVLAAAALQKVGVDLGLVYQRVPDTAVVSLNGRRVFYPCPRCRWPMNVRGVIASCHRSIACLAAGARFDLGDGKIVGLGSLPPPDPVAEAGMAALRPGVWRFTVLPGLEELDLAGKLASIDGVQVELWPFVDAYDLDVRRAEQHWRIDVKDHNSAVALARHLNKRPSQKATWIVVPDARRDQLPVLRKLVAPDAGYQFACASEMVRRVKGTA